MQSLSRLPNTGNQICYRECGQLSASTNAPRLKCLLLLGCEVQHMQRKIQHHIRLIARWHHKNTGSTQRETHGSIEVLRDGYVCQKASSHNPLTQFAGEFYAVTEQAIHA